MGGITGSTRVIAVICLLLLGCFLVGVVIFARMMAEKWTTEIVITSDRLIYKRDTS